MATAAVCAALAAFVAFAAAASHARKVVQKLADVEAAVWYYADKVQAAEMPLNPLNPKPFKPKTP